jgi:hypothetical protein
VVEGGKNSRSSGDLPGKREATSLQSCRVLSHSPIPYPALYGFRGGRIMKAEQRPETTCRCHYTRSSEEQTGAAGVIEAGKRFGKVGHRYDPEKRSAA